MKITLAPMEGVMDHHMRQLLTSIGGIDLYSKEDFLENGVKLFFIESSIVEYKQFKEPFVPGLSIIDVLMFNSKEEVKQMLDQYTLV